MPFPYELYPKAKETHCLNLPEISVSRPPFPGSIRTADGCFWGERNNNSYVSTHKTDKVCTADGKCYNYNDVFVDEVDPGHSNTCGQTCYVACSCNTSNGWYSSCQGSDCFSVTDTRYAGQPNAASASRSLSDIGSISASGANSGISASAAATSGISTMAAAATTCYKVRGCDEGWFEEKPSDMFSYKSTTTNGKNCYQVTGCSLSWTKYKTGTYQSNDTTLYYENYEPQGVSCYAECDGIKSITVAPKLSGNDVRYYLTSAVCKNGSTYNSSTGRMLDYIGDRLDITGTITDRIEMNTTGITGGHIYCEVEYSNMHFNGTSAYGYATSFNKLEPSDMYSGSIRQEISPCRQISMDYLEKHNGTCNPMMSGHSLTKSFTGMKYNGTSQSGYTIYMDEPPELDCDSGSTGGGSYYMHAEVQRKSDIGPNGEGTWRLQIIISEAGGITPMEEWPFKWSSLNANIYCGISDANSTISYNVTKTQHETTFTAGGGSYTGCREDRVTIKSVYPGGNAFRDLTKETFEGYRIIPEATGN